jgi:2-phosphosulfolactate phosphatase
MTINILQLLEGAQQARGLTVIIDVFRAFTVAPLLIDKGASELIPVETVEQAFLLKAKYQDAVMIGERNEQKIDGFDYGNSPTHLTDAQLYNKRIIHTTSSGTKGITNARLADEIITGSFVNINAIVNYIQAQNPKNVSLVCMGYACQYPTEEDTFCAEYIAAILKGETPDFEKMKEIIRTTSGARFFDPSKASFSPQSDFDICMKINTFNFVLKAQKADDGFFRLHKILM